MSNNKPNKAPTADEVAKKQADIILNEAQSEANKVVADEAALAAEKLNGELPTEEVALEAPTASAATAAETPAVPATVTAQTEIAAAAHEAAAPAATETPVAAPVITTANKATLVHAAPVIVAPLGTAKPDLTDAYQLPLSTSVAAKLNIAELKEYIAQMSPSVRLTPEQGGIQQTILYQILIQAINTPAEEFGVVFSLLIKIIKENLDGVFAPENLHRYTPHVTMAQASVTHFRHLLNALTALADPATRQIAVRQINVEQALGDRKIQEEARQRVMSFFNLG